MLKIHSFELNSKVNIFETGVNEYPQAIHDFIEEVVSIPPKPKSSLARAAIEIPT